MCLSTVYKNEYKPECLLMENVMLIKNSGSDLVITDLLGRQTIFNGRITVADLNNDYVIVKSHDA